MGARQGDRTKLVLIGIGLIVAGLFSLLSLIPVEVLGEDLRALFPSDNLIGPVGAAVANSLIGSFGISAALVPFLPILWGGYSLDALDRSDTGRWTIVLALIVFLTPPFLASTAYPAGGGPEWLAGGYGGFAGQLLASFLGWLGSAIVLFGVLAFGLIATLGLGPFEAIARLALAARGGARVAIEAGKELTRYAAAAGRWLARVSAAAAARAPSWLLPRRKKGLLTALGEDAAEAPGAAEPATAGDGRGQNESSAPRQLDLLDVGDPKASDLPPLELLASPPEQRYAVSEDSLDELGEVLVEKLRTFRVQGHIAGRTTGPVVTQFEVVPASGVKVGKIASLADDLALALKAPSIRIIAPIPGKGAVGVEVPNQQRKIVYIREILESSAYTNSRAELPLALGEDVTGQPDVYDLAKMPHLLIAGVTGSGKSVCINAIITSLIYRYAPEQLRLLLIDPKMVELGGYSILPHLRHAVVTDNRDAASVLKWLVFEMESRYEWLSANGCRNLREYNRLITQGIAVRAPMSRGGGEVQEPEILPYIVLVIDELADLMMTVQAEVERPLAYLAQKARATGIHLVVATQRPSVNVITGLIKANFPCRAAFRVASKVDSRTIIDQNGAETLLGNGDVLFLPPGESEPVRIQGTYVSTEDTERLMHWYATAEELQTAQGEDDILEVVHQRELEEAEATQDDDVAGERDPLFRRAGELVLQHRQGSTSLLQRRLKIGYGRAARIVDQLEHAGIVGPPEGSKPREVLITLDELDRIARPGTEGER